MEVGGGVQSHVSMQPFSRPQGLSPHLALEKYSSDKGTGCWGQKGGTGAMGLQGEAGHNPTHLHCPCPRPHLGTQR